MAKDKTPDPKPPTRRAPRMGDDVIFVARDTPFDQSDITQPLRPAKVLEVRADGSLKVFVYDAFPGVTVSAAEDPAGLKAGSWHWPKAEG